MNGSISATLGDLHLIPYREDWREGIKIEDLFEASNRIDSVSFYRLSQH